MVWPGVLRCLWVGGSVVAGRCPSKDSQQLHHNRMIIVAQFVCHLVLMLWLIELQVSVKIGIPIILDSIFHKLYFVLWALRSSALFIRKFREYGVWALLCLIKSNCMVPKLLFKHPKHVFHPVVIYRRFGFSQKHLNWNKTGLRQHSKLVVCVGQLGAAHKLLAGKRLSAYRSIPNLVCKIKMRLDNDAADQLPKGTCGPSFYQLP